VKIVVLNCVVFPKLDRIPTVIKIKLEKVMDKKVKSRKRFAYWFQVKILASRIADI
jgi:hypothetical protein